MSEECLSTGTVYPGHVYLGEKSRRLGANVGAIVRCGKEGWC